MRKLLFALILFCAAPAFAQNTTSVTSSGIRNAAGTLLASGSLCFQGTDQNNTPISFQQGGGGPVITTPVCTSITNGAISGFAVSNPANTSPANIRYHVQIKQGARIVSDLPGVYLCNQSGACTTPFAFNFDNCFSSGACVASPIPLVGIPGSPGPSCVSVIGVYASGTTYAAGNCVTYNGTVYISLVNSNLGNTPSSSPSDWSGLPSTNSINTWATSQNFCGPNPLTDIQCYGARPLLTNLGNLNTAATCSGSSCTLGTAGQFLNSDYLWLAGAGSTNSVGTSAPAAPTVTASVTTGPMLSGLVSTIAAPAVARTYKIAICDEITFACTPASTAGSTGTSTGPAALGRATISLTSGSQSGNLVTVTTAATHDLPIGCSNTSCPEVQIWKEVATDAHFTGFARAVSVADNTHFTYNTAASTTFGGIATGFTGGYLQYFVEDHIVCPAVSASFVCAVYDGGTGNFIGLSRKGENYWDYYGSTLSGNPARPAWIPATAPATYQNDGISVQITAGGGSTSVTITPAVSTAVTSQYTTIDQCPNIQSAITAAILGGSQVWVPPTYGPGHYSFVIGSYCSIPSFIQVRQSGGIYLNNTVVTLNGYSVLIANKNGSSNGGGQIIENNIPGGIYLASTYAGSTIDGINVRSTNANNSLLILSDQSTYDIVKNSTFIAGNTSSSSYTGMGMVIRSQAFDNHFSDNQWFGDYPGGAVNLGDTTAPNILVQAGSSEMSLDMDHDNMYAKGIAYLSTLGPDFHINYSHIQGPVQPFFTMNAGYTIRCMFTHAGIDSTSAPILAILYQNITGIRNTCVFDFPFPPNQDTSGFPPILSGGPVADLQVRGLGNGHPVGQNYNVRNEQDSGLSNYGGTYASAPFPSQRPYLGHPEIIASGSHMSFAAEVLTAVSSTTASGGGSVPAGSHCWTVTTIFPSGAESAMGASQCLTIVGGTQTVSVAFTPVAGFTYNICRDGVKTNGGGQNISSSPYSDSNAFTGSSCPAYSGDGYPRFGADGYLGPYYGGAETTAPTGMAAWDFIYPDSSNHRLEMVNNSGAADPVVGQATTDTLTNKTLTAPVINGGSVNPVNLLLNATAPTISVHFNTSGDSISANNGTASFTVTIGSGAAGSTGAVALPTAHAGWNCIAQNRNRADDIQQTGSTTGTATFTNYGTTLGTPVNWTNGDVLGIICFAY